MKKIINTTIKEIIPITIGILIALFINNWNEQRKDEKYINQILISINEELNESYNSVTTQKPNQKKLIDTLDIYLKDNKKTLMDVVIRGNGISFPSIKTNAWKAVSNSKIELLEYDLISTLSNIENQKQLLKLQTENLISYLFTNAEETGEYKKLVLKLMMRDIIRNSTELEKEIKKIIDK